MKELIMKYPLFSAFIGFFFIFLLTMWYIKGFIITILIMSISGMVGVLVTWLSRI